MSERRVYTADIPQWSRDGCQRDYRLLSALWWKYDSKRVLQFLTRLQNLDRRATAKEMQEVF